MYITYHQSCDAPESHIEMPFYTLAPEIQDKLKEWNVKQPEYKVGCNGYYLFIALDNGDRVDVHLYK